MTSKSSPVVNRYPADVVYLVAEKLIQVLNDVGGNTAIMTGDFTPTVLSERNTRLRTATTVVADAESKLKSYRDNRDDDSNETFEAIVRLHDLARGVFGARSVEYKRVKSVYDELRKKRSRKSGNSSGPTSSSSALGADGADGTGATA